MQDSPQAFRSSAAVTAFLLIFAVLLSADLLSKHIAFDRLALEISGTPPARVDVLSSDVVVIPKILHFHVTANQGAVFGIGQGRRWLFVLVSIGAIGFLLYLFGTSPANRRWQHLLLAMFAAGVIGNMYDRLTLGYVRDMLWMLPNLKWRQALPFLPDVVGRYDVFPWIFNLADSYLVIGVGVVIVHTMFSKAPRPELQKPVIQNGTTEQPVIPNGTPEGPTRRNA